MTGWTSSRISGWEVRCWWWLEKEEELGSVGKGRKTTWTSACAGDNSIRSWLLSAQGGGERFCGRGEEKELGTILGEWGRFLHHKEVTAHNNGECKVKLKVCSSFIYVYRGDSSEEGSTFLSWGTSLFAWELLVLVLQVLKKIYNNSSSVVSTGHSNYQQSNTSGTK